MTGVPAETAVASASGSGIWSRRRDEITFDRLQKVRSRARCSGAMVALIRVVRIGVNWWWYPRESAPELVAPAPALNWLGFSA
jgi:hypothetical protein